jgi:hypothetical protein
MALIQIDPIAWIPDHFKQQIVDNIVTFIANQAKKLLGDEVSRSLGQLRSDAALQKAVDQGLQQAWASSNSMPGTQPAASCAA